MTPRIEIPRKPATVEAVLELVLAGLLWGFGFIATIWALRGMGPLSITGWRFAIASLVTIGVAAAVPRLRSHLRMDQFLLAMIPGALICITIFVQTWGLKYTTVTKSGFITTLYVLMVPFLESFMLKRRIHGQHLCFALLAFVGVGLICDFAGDLTGTATGTATATATATATGTGMGTAALGDPRLRWNFGDFLTFLCALAATLHIVWFGKIQNRIGSAFVFNGFQSFWASIIPLILSFFMEPMPHPSFADNSIYGFASLAFCSTLIAFALQVRAQKTLTPSVASLLFLLESPFATLFAVFFLGEHLKISQWIGAVLILLAAVLSTTIETKPSAGIQAG